MLAKRPECSVPFVVLLLVIFIFTAFTFYDWNEITSLPINRILPLHDSLWTASSSDESGSIDADVDPYVYREVYSVSTADKKYFLVDFVDQKAINPNIIPHPFLKDTWVIVAQRHDPREHRYFTQLACNAVFQSGTLRCVENSSTLPIAATSGDKCTGDLEFFNLSQGPHDARVFYGPEAPYTVFGSNSMFTCFGQVVQDFRSLMDWGNTTFPDTLFKNGTEIQRPPPYGVIEKNWFLFWDQDGQIYAHYDITPKRVFAKLEMDGSVGEDLAPQAAFNDEKCMAKYMPPTGPYMESIHQATNSVSITLCERSDPACTPNDVNTFILAIFQFKSFYSFHGVYEPYAILFEQKAPFKIYGISTKPIWIHGRRKAGEEEPPVDLIKDGIEDRKPWNQTEMFYVTSMSWKTHGQKYHGYQDDVVFLGFGIEDSQAAGIDVVVGDLLMDLGLCSNS